MNNLSLKTTAFMLAFICIMIACEDSNDAVAPVKKTLSGEELSDVVSEMSSFQNLIILIDQRNEQIQLNIEALTSDDNIKLTALYQKHSDFNDFLKNASFSEREILNQVLKSSNTDKIRSNFISMVKELSDKYEVNFKELSNILNHNTKVKGTIGKADTVCDAVANQMFWDVVDSFLSSGESPQTSYNAGKLAYAYTYIGCVRGRNAGNPE